MVDGIDDFDRELVRAHRKIACAEAVGRDQAHAKRAPVKPCLGGLVNLTEIERRTIELLTKLEGKAVAVGARRAREGAV